MDLERAQGGGGGGARVFVGVRRGEDERCKWKAI